MTPQILLTIRKKPKKLKQSGGGPASADLTGPLILCSGRPRPAGVGGPRAPGAAAWTSDAGCDVCGPRIRVTVHRESVMEPVKVNRFPYNLTIF
jgi:hypothetical protein